MVIPTVENGNQAVGVGLYKRGLANDPHAFLLTFERVGMQADWIKRQWALRLALYLSGEAQAAYLALSDDMVKAAILD